MGLRHASGLSSLPCRLVVWLARHSTHHVPPAGFAALGSVLLLWVRPAGVPDEGAWLRIGIQVLIWGLAGVMCARKCSLPRRPDGTLTPLYHRLVTTHWLRVGLITAFALLMLSLIALSVR